MLRALVASTPTCACGYMNSAIADPIASVAYGSELPLASRIDPEGLPVFGFTAVNFVCAASKMCDQPPGIRVGM